MVTMGITDDEALVVTKEMGIEHDACPDHASTSTTLPASSSPGNGLEVGSVGGDRRDRRGGRRGPVEVSAAGAGEIKASSSGPSRRLEAAT